MWIMLFIRVMVYDGFSVILNKRKRYLVVNIKQFVNK